MIPITEAPFFPKEGVYPESRKAVCGLLEVRFPLLVYGGGEEGDEDEGDGDEGEENEGDGEEGAGEPLLLRNASASKLGATGEKKGAPASGEP